jgi:hypothetical protein
MPHAICAHAGGPLDKHAQGPTTFDQPVYEVRRDEAGTGYEARRVG